MRNYWLDCHQILTFMVPWGCILQDGNSNNHSCSLDFLVFATKRLRKLFSVPDNINANPENTYLTFFSRKLYFWFKAEICTNGGNCKWYWYSYFTVCNQLQDKFTMFSIYLMFIHDVLGVFVCTELYVLICVCYYFSCPQASRVA